MVRMGSKIGCRWVQVYEHTEWGQEDWLSLMSRIELMTENCRSEMNSAKITNVTQSISNRLKSIHVVCCRDPHNSEHLFATCRTSRLTGYRLMHGFGLYTGIRSTVKWPANRYSVMYNHTSRLCSPEVQNVSCVIGVTHTSPHWPSPHSRHSSVRSHWTPRAPHPIISCLLQKLAHICSLWQLLPQDFDRANWFLVPHFSIAFDNKHWALNTHNKKLVVSVVRP